MAYVMYNCNALQKSVENMYRNIYQTHSSQEKQSDMQLIV